VNTMIGVQQANRRRNTFNHRNENTVIETQSVA